ncbi:MAG TPA: glycosyltransferase [Blastocatellia bacterium]|nr:glycosyltransferase [Blastocatellia bacterium]
MSENVLSATKGAGEMAEAARRLRVVRIIDRLNVGGPAKHVVWLAAGLDSKRFETVLITGTVPEGEGDMSYFARSEGVEPVIIREMSRELGPRDLVVIFKLLKELWRVRPDIVHTHKSKAGAAGRVAAMIYKWLTPSALWLRPRGCRVVHTYHGHIFHSYYGAAKTRLFLSIDRMLARFCTDCIITISEQQRRELAHRFRIGPRDRFRVVPLGIDCDEAGDRHGSLAEEFGIAPHELVVGTVGRLCGVKNYALLLDASARALGPGERLVIVGDGHLRRELEEKALALAMGDRVVFTGFRSDAPSLYRDLDVLALTSLNEGTPLTLIEAMNAGLPVVSTEVGGVPDIMGARRDARDGFTVWDHGLTVASGDAEAFALALRYLLGRPDLRREMGARGRAFVRARLSRDRLVGDMERLYEEVINQGDLT